MPCRADYPRQAQALKRKHLNQLWCGVRGSDVLGDGFLEGSSEVWRVLSACVVRDQAPNPALGNEKRASWAV